MNSSIVLTLAMVAAMSFAGQATAANIVTNGSFESNPPVEATFSVLELGNSSALPGWVVSGVNCNASCVAILTNSYFESGLAFTAQSGTQSVDLDQSQSAADGGIYQMVATTPGVQYLLSFYVGNQDDTFYPGLEAVSLLIDDAQTSTHTNSHLTTNNINWLLVTSTFTALNPSTKIEFQKGSTNGYSGLDNVSLEAVVAAPEPGTLALGCLALAVVAGMRRKLRRR